MADAERRVRQDPSGGFHGARFDEIKTASAAVGRQQPDAILRGRSVVQLSQTIGDLLDEAKVPPILCRCSASERRPGRVRQTEIATTTKKNATAPLLPRRVVIRRCRGDSRRLSESKAVQRIRDQDLREALAIYAEQQQQQQQQEQQQQQHL